jgi:hypothetical protein
VLVRADVRWIPTLQVDFFTTCKPGNRNVHSSNAPGLSAVAVHAPLNYPGLNALTLMLLNGHPIRFFQNLEA